MIVLRMLGFFLVMYVLIFIAVLRTRYRLDAVTAIVALALTILVWLLIWSEGGFQAPS
jgi:hypothetical protein